VATGNNRRYAGSLKEEQGVLPAPAAPAVVDAKARTTYCKGESTSARNSWVVEFVDT
jgi:hypothetical protein